MIIRLPENFGYEYGFFDVQNHVRSSKNKYTSESVSPQSAVPSLHQYINTNYNFPDFYVSSDSPYIAVNGKNFTRSDFLKMDMSKILSIFGEVSNFWNIFKIDTLYGVWIISATCSYDAELHSEILTKEQYLEIVCS